MKRINRKKLRKILLQEVAQVSDLNKMPLKGGSVVVAPSLHRQLEEIRKYMVSKYGKEVYKDGYEVYSTINSQHQLSANKPLKME